MPQPIDMQTELGRTIMAERIQNAAGRATLAAQQRTQLKEEEARVAKESEVHETPETQSEHVDKDAERKNLHAEQRGKRSEDNETPDEDAHGRPKAGRRPTVTSAGDDHILDVKI